jgi:hypothetical protein
MLASCICVEDDIRTGVISFSVAVKITTLSPFVLASKHFSVYIQPICKKPTRYQTVQIPEAEAERIPEALCSGQSLAHRTIAKINH